MTRSRINPLQLLGTRRAVKGIPSHSLLYVPLTLNGREAQAMVDTGATHNFIREGTVWVERWRAHQPCQGNQLPGPGGSRQSALRMKALLSRHNYWPDMGEDIEAYVKLCQQDKSERRREAGLLQPLPVPERPWQSRQADREVCCRSISVTMCRLRRGTG